MQKRTLSFTRHSLMNPQRVVGLVLALLLVLLVGLPVYAQEPLVGFDEYVEQAMADWNVPGLAIAIVKDDEIVLAKGYGLREIGKEETVDEHTVFAIGSSTKAFAAASVALLVDEGQMGWDDPVTDYLPDFQMYDPWVTREITVRDSLCHRSGLPHHGGDVLFYAFGYDRDELLRRIRYLKPASSFRSEFAYQNLMVLVAGQAAAAASGQSWDELVMERIFAPLEMTESSTSITALPDFENVATPHAEVGGQVQAIPWHNVDNEAPAGSINSSALDMAQWLKLQLGGGLYEGQQLLNSASVQEMHTPQTIIPLEPPWNLLAPGASFLSYGLGWFLHDYAGRRVVWHDGMVSGMSAMVAMIPQENLGLVILTNMHQSVLPHALTYRVFDAFLGLPERDQSAEFLGWFNAYMEQAEAALKQMMEARVEGTKPSLLLEEYAGTYVDDLYGEIKVTVEDGKLVEELGVAALKADLEHWHYDTFLIAWRGFSVIPKIPATFTLDAMGQVDEMKVQLEEFVTASFKRVPEAAGAPAESP